jgi:hypothetical protein
VGLIRNSGYGNVLPEKGTASPLKKARLATRAGWRLYFISCIFLRTDARVIEAASRYSHDVVKGGRGGGAVKTTIIEEDGEEMQAALEVQQRLRAAEDALLVLLEVPLGSNRSRIL